MQTVINVNNELYEYFSKRKTMHDDGYFSHVGKLIKAFRDGTILPKGHGRLMILSEDKLKENLFDLAFSCEKWISEVGLSNATVTIIEADKKESENKSNCSTCANANNVVVCPYTVKDIAAEEGCKFWHEAEIEPQESEVNDG